MQILHENTSVGAFLLQSGLSILPYCRPGKGPVHLQSFFTMLIKNTCQALNMQLVLCDCLFIVIFNSLVGYGLQLNFTPHTVVQIASHFT